MMDSPSAEIRPVILDEFTCFSCRYHDNVYFNVMSIMASGTEFIHETGDFTGREKKR